jgi:hypothetical protein
MRYLVELRFYCCHCKQSSARGLQQQGKRHNGYLSVVCINNDNKGRTENECSPCERPEKNYLATSITINSDYKKIKKEVFLFVTDAIAIFFDNEKVTIPASVGWPHSLKTTIDIHTKVDAQSKDDICILKLG